MRKILKKGMVVKLDEISNQKYIIVEIAEKNNKEYLLLTDFEGEIDYENSEIKNLKIDFDKAFMVSYDIENNEFSYDKDEQMIELLVNKSLDTKKNI